MSTNKITQTDQLIGYLSEYALVSREEASAFIHALIQTINLHLQRGEEIHVSGLGHFRVLEVRNGKSKRVAFTADEAFKKEINSPFECFEPFVISNGILNSDFPISPIDEIVNDTNNADEFEEDLSETSCNENKTETSDVRCMDKKEERDNELADSKDNNSLNPNFDSNLVPIKNESISLTHNQESIKDNPSKLDTDEDKDAAESKSNASIITKTNENGKTRNRRWIYVVIMLVFLSGLAYLAHVMISDTQTIEVYNIPTENSITPTYDNVKVIITDSTNIQGDTLVETQKTKSMDAIINISKDTILTTTPDTSVKEANPIESKKQESTEFEKSKPITIPNEAFATDSSNTPILVYVKEGERLTVIAERLFGNKAFWSYLYEVNKDKYPIPGNVPVGARLRIPNTQYWNIDVNDESSLRKARQLGANILNNNNN